MEKAEHQRRDPGMRARIKSKKLRATILAGSLALAFGPFVPKALAQTDTSIVVGSRSPGAEAIAGNDAGSSTIPNSSYSGTGPAPAAAIPDHPTVDTPS